MATETAKKLIGDIQNLCEDIRSTIESFGHNISHDRTVELYIDEIVARLFLKVYGMHPSTNIYAYQKRTISDIPTDDMDSFDNAVRRMRREEKKQQEALNRFIEHLNSKGHNIPNIVPAKEENSKEIRKDTANLIMVDHMLMHDFRPATRNGITVRKQIDTLLDILAKGTVSSHNLTVDTFVDSFRQISEAYEISKGITNKREYIDHWIHFYRLETHLHVSLINQIADYMIEHNIKKFSNNTDLPHLLWGTVEIQNIISEPFSVLRYDRYIRLYFSDTDTEKLTESVKLSRIEQVLLIYLFITQADDVFEPYFKQDADEEIVDIIYSFCKERYPIIEAHNPFDFYETDAQKYSYKARCLRNIINDLVPPHEIKQYYNPPYASFENK